MPKAIFFKRQISAFRHYFLAGLFSLNSTICYADVSFYVGADVNYQNLLINSKTGIKPTQEIKNSSDFYQTQTIGPALYIGFDNNRNLRLEIGATTAIGEKKKKNAFQSGSNQIATNFKITTNVYSLEFKPYYDLNKKSLIYGIIGYNYFDILLEREAYSEILGVKYSDREKVSTKSLAPTIGFGGEYSFNSHFFIRTQLKYSYINSKVKYVENNREIIKYRGAFSLGTGLGYRF